ncbi:hypothetical protein CGCF413_v014044 [Colletotrichum fructicola]|nr:hypothetical protein CGCF413_v014044 [Colletotrichum fructicola]
MERLKNDHAIPVRHSSSKPEPTNPQANETKRHANVYDAVAGRISYETNLSSAVSIEKTSTMAPRPARPSRSNRHSVRSTTLAPEEVLFRRKSAPERFAEFDVYMAHERNLPDGGRESLPDSDLVKAVHSYASHFYFDQKRSADFQVGTRNIDERSMDETALLAFGILLEEAGREILGTKGDMVFTEGLDISSDAEPAPEAHPMAANGLVHSVSDSSVRPPVSVGFTDLGSWKRPQKRRKMTDLEDA